MKELYTRPVPSEIGQATRESEQTTPILTILTGPSGVGKSTLLTELLARHTSELTGLPSITDRPREGIDRKQSVSSSVFTEMEQKDEFCFVTEKHGYRYGTSRELVEDALTDNKRIVMDFPLEKLTLLQEHLRLPSQVVFILPPSFEEHITRLSSRLERWPVARQDIQELGHLSTRQKIDYFLVNSNLDRSVIELEKLILRN